MRFAFIHTEKATVPLAHLCQILNVSRSGFYAWARRPPSAHAQRDRRLRVLIRASHEASRRTYGSSRIHRDLRDQGHHVSRKRVIRLQQAEGLTARVRKRFKRTTMSDHDQPVAANVLGQDFVAAAPNRRWVGDTTEFVIGRSGKLYLAAILDLYSRFLVGWAVSAINDRHLVIRALQMALKRREPAAGLLHHSDQGSPYASEDYQRIITAHRMTGSMSRRGNCYDCEPSRGIGLTGEERDLAGGVIRLSPARAKTLVGRILPFSLLTAEALARRRARRDPNCPPRRTFVMIAVRCQERNPR